MRPLLCVLLLTAPAALAQAPVPAAQPVELGCLTFELRAATFRAIDTDTPPTFRQAMHQCVVSGAAGKQAPRRT